MTHPLGRFIRARRLELELSQYDLSVRLGIPRSSLVRWECGRRPVPDDVLPRLADALSVAPACLESLRLDPPRLARVLHCTYAPLDPVKCSIEEMVTGTSLGRRLSGEVRERVGAARYDELRHALLRDTRWELLLAHRLLTDTAGLSWLTPLEEGCDLLVVAEDRQRYVGHPLRLAIVWERDDERMVFLPQVPIGVPKVDERFRVEYLALYTRRGQTMPPVVVELDGDSVHRLRTAQDTRRTELLRLPVIRFDNCATEDPYFLAALLDAMRGKAEYARISGEAYQAFLTDRRERVAAAARQGLLRA